MLHIANKTKGKRPRLPFSRITDLVLGPDYDLSLVFIGSKRSQKLNREYRGRDYPANVLSFPLSEDAGEMFIDLTEARKQASSFDLPYQKFVGYLFIHGLLHLKGYTHGSKMEREEMRIRRQFRFI